MLFIVAKENAEPGGKKAGGIEGGFSKKAAFDVIDSFRYQNFLFLQGSCIILEFLDFVFLPYRSHA